MSEHKEQAQNEDQSLEQTLNIGSEVVLAAPSAELPEGIKKNIKIGTIGLLRQVRSRASETQGVRFSYAIGRPVLEAGEVGEEKYPKIDFPSIEKLYRHLFGLVLVEGLTDEEYDLIDPDGINKLDELIERFL